MAPRSLEDFETMPLKEIHGRAVITQRLTTQVVSFGPMNASLFGAVGSSYIDDDKTPVTVFDGHRVNPMKRPIGPRKSHQPIWFVVNPGVMVKVLATIVSDIHELGIWIFRDIQTGAIGRVLRIRR